MRKKLDSSNQIIKGYEGNIGDNKTKNDISDNYCGVKVKMIVLRKKKFKK